MTRTRNCASSWGCRTWALVVALILALSTPLYADASTAEACDIYCPWPQVPVARLRGWTIQFLATVNDPGFSEEYDVTKNSFVNVSALDNAAAPAYVVHKGTSSACNTGTANLQDFLRNYDDRACEPPARRYNSPGYSCTLTSEDCQGPFDIVVPLAAAARPRCLPPSRRRVLISSNLRTVEKDYDASRNTDNNSYVSWQSLQDRIYDLSNVDAGVEQRIMFTRSSLDGRRQRLRANVTLGCEALPEFEDDPCKGIEVQDDGSHLQVLSAPAGCTFLTNGCSTPEALDAAVNDEIMREACYAHDLCYECAHTLGWNDMDRRRCDTRFRSNMRAICDAQFEPAPWYGFLQGGSWAQPEYRGQCRTLAKYMYRTVKNFQNGLDQYLDHHSRGVGCSPYIAEAYPNIYNGARYLSLPADRMVTEADLDEPLRP